MIGLLCPAGKLGHDLPQGSTTSYVRTYVRNGARPVTDCTDCRKSGGDDDGGDDPSGFVPRPLHPQTKEEQARFF